MRPDNTLLAWEFFPDNALFFSTVNPFFTVDDVWQYRNNTLDESYTTLCVVNARNLANRYMRIRVYTCYGVYRLYIVQDEYEFSICYCIVMGLRFYFLPRSNDKRDTREFHLASIVHADDVRQDLPTETPKTSRLVTIKRGCRWKTELLVGKNVSSLSNLSIFNPDK